MFFWLDYIAFVKEGKLNISIDDLKKRFLHFDDSILFLCFVKTNNDIIAGNTTEN